MRSKAIISAVVGICFLGCGGPSPENQVNDDSLLMHVLENKTLKPIDSAVLVIHDTGSNVTYERRTGPDGIALLREPVGTLSVKLFPPGHLPMYTTVEAGVDSATMLTNPVIPVEDENGVFYAYDQGGMIIEPVGEGPKGMSALYLHVKRDINSVINGGMGALAQSFYRGELPAGAVVTIKATWEANENAPVTVSFIDAQSGDTVKSVKGEFFRVGSDRVVQFIAPELNAMPEGTFAVATADLAPDASAVEANSIGNCCPADGWSCTCKDGPSQGQGILNCCSAPPGTTCSGSQTISVSGSVTVSITGYGSVTFGVSVSETNSCSTTAGNCVEYRLGSLGCAYLQCSIFGRQADACLGHNCTFLRCSDYNCDMPVWSCPALTCGVSLGCSAVPDAGTGSDAGSGGGGGSKDGGP